VGHAQGFDEVLDRLRAAEGAGKLNLPPRRGQEVVQVAVESKRYLGHENEEMVRGLNGLKRIFTNYLGFLPGGMNPAAVIQNRLKSVGEISYNLIYQVLCISGGFESAAR
jgi:hypothetical protein